MRTSRLTLRLTVPPLASWAFALLLLAAWLLLHLYRGVSLDAVVYGMQGLSHWRPDLYAHDIYLRYGSQDRFTLFGPIYGGLIGVMGFEHAALCLWLLAQGLLLTAAWTLARRLMPSAHALLALGLFIALELPYGPRGMFYVLEDVTTPRLFAEGLVLFALRAMAEDRAARAAVLLAAALLLHPLMAIGGCALWLWQRLLAPRPKFALITLLVLFTALIVSSFTPLGQLLRMDDAWWQAMTGNNPYLLASNWLPTDWARTLTPLVTLSVGWVALPDGIARRLCAAALATAVGGLLLTLIGADGLHYALLVQAQPWRWQWLAAALATLMLPLIGTRLMERGALGRAALALLIALYIAHDVLYAMPAALLIWAFAWRAGDATVPTRGLFMGLVVLSIAALSFALWWDLRLRYYSLYTAYFSVPGHVLIELARRLTRDSALPALLLLGTWVWLFARPSRIRPWSVAAVGLLSSLALLPVTASQWSQTDFSDELIATYSPWRALITPGAEVLWVENPLYPWLLLQRPSYLSDAQLGSTLFSRSAALELRSRLMTLQPFLAAENPNAAGARPSSPTLKELCGATSVQYIVSAQDLGAAPLAQAPPGADPAFASLNLYVCPSSSP